MWEEHKQYTLEFLHFLRTDSGKCQQRSAKFANLSLCKKMNLRCLLIFRPRHHVRESRRMKGMYVLSQRTLSIRPRKRMRLRSHRFQLIRMTVSE
ncbi:MAG: hypothetical protein U0936_14780 [Planctomycetaceae bacterium]